MKKEVLMYLLPIFIILLFGGVAFASLYAEKIPDPSRFTSIEPFWSAILQKTDGTSITISLLKFEWLSYENQIEHTAMFYLNDGIDEYIAEGGKFYYADDYDYVCSSQEDYNNCVEGCGDNESCIDQCAQNYQCDNIITCLDFGPDNTCGLRRTIVNFGISCMELFFEPNTGQLIKGTWYDSNKCEQIMIPGEPDITQSLNPINQAGFVSAGRLS